MYDEDILLDIKDNVSLLGIVYSFMVENDFFHRLKVGIRHQYWFDLCPFHEVSDIHPTFYVDEEKKLFYCFGCGGAGNSLDFWMMYYDICLDSAVRILSRFIGYHLEFLSEQERDIYNLLSRHYDVYQVLEEESIRREEELLVRIRRYFWQNEERLRRFGSINYREVADRLCCQEELIRRVYDGLYPESSGERGKCKVYRNDDFELMFNLIWV